MEKISKFQIILIGTFSVLILISVIVFSKYKGSSADQVEVTVWGTMSSFDFNKIVDLTSLKNNKLLKVTYVQKEPTTFDQDFVEALAAGGGPDLFILPQDKIVRQKNKIILVPFSSFSERTYKDSFIEGTEIFLDPNGIIAMPLIVDPLVMYWNRSIFNDAKVTNPPKYWDEFYNLASLISVKDGALNISRSLVSFGEYRNVTNSKEILSTLMMQAGTPIVQVSGNATRGVIADSFDKPVIPGEAAVNFYTEFSNPAKPFYSWNRSMPQSSAYFLSGDQALYFGFSSEIFDIQKKNPNLNFDVAPIPTSREGGTNVGFAKFYGLAISRGSKNSGAAFAVSSILSSAEGIKAVSDTLNLPPVRRDLLAVKQTDAFKTVFYDSAIRSKAWLDPDPVSTNDIFARMIESITSGRERTSAAVVKASREITNLFENKQ